MVSHDRTTSSAAPAAAGAGVKRASTDSRVYDTSAGTRTRLVYYQTGDGQWVTMAEPEDDTFEEDRSSNTSSICGCAVWVFVLIIVLISVLVLGGIIVAIVLLAANNASDTGNNHTPAQPRPPPTGDDILDSLVNMNKDVPEENLPGYHQRHVSAYTRLASPSGNLLAEITNNVITGEDRYSYTATDRLFDDGQTIVAFLSRIGVRSRSTQTVLPQNFTQLAQRDVEYRTSFGLRVDIGDSPDWQNHLVLLDTGGGAMSYFLATQKQLQDSGFRNRNTGRGRTHNSTTKKDIHIVTKFQKDRDYVECRYVGGCHKGRLVGDRWKIAGSNAQLQLKDNNFVPSDQKTLPLVYVQEPGRRDNPDGGNFGLGFRTETWKSNMFTSEISTILDQFRLHSVYRGAAAGLANDPFRPMVYSFQLARPTGEKTTEWHVYPQLVINSLPPDSGDRLRAFDLAQQNFAVRAGDVLLQKLESEWGQEGAYPREIFNKIKSARIDKDEHTLNYLRSKVLRKIYNGDFGTPQKREQTTTSPFYKQIVKPATDFRPTFWQLHITRVRIGKTVVEAEKDMFKYKFNDARARMPEPDPNKRLDATFKPTTDWEYGWDAFDQNLADRSASVFDQTDLKRKVHPINGPLHTTKIRMVAVDGTLADNFDKDQDEHVHPDKRYLAVVDSGWSMLSLAKPLYRIFHRKLELVNFVCEDGPELGFEFETGTERHWYFLTPKDYCFCQGVYLGNKKVNSCVDDGGMDGRDGTAVMLGMPFHRAFYVGYDYNNRKLWLPKM